MTEAKSLYVVLSANAAAYRAALAAAGHDTDRFGNKVDAAKRSLGDLDGGFDAGGNVLDRYSSRLGLIVRGATVLTPVMSSLAAAAVPVLTTFANLAGVSVLAGGSAAIAFQGVADGYTALQKFQDDPTAENLEAVHLAFEKLGPDARNLIVAVDELTPALKSVRDASAAGLFPFLEQSLDDVEGAIPGIRRFVGEYASIVGELTAANTESLTSDRWSEFAGFLEGEGRPTLTRMNAAAGDLTHGLSELWMAFDPLNDSILGSLTRGADSFDRWASTLDQTQGFEKFMEYVRTTGPMVVDTTQAIGESIIDIGVAAAPMSESTLGGLEGFFSLISEVADSEAGQALLVYATAASAAALAQRGWQAVSSTALVGSLRGQGAAARTLYADLRLLASGYRDASMAQRTMTTGLIAQRTGQALRSSGKGLAAGAGIAAVSTGAADQFGLQNTATLALTGAMIGGVPGAVAGGLVGAYLDVQQAQKSTTDTTKALADAFSDQSATVGDQATALDNAFTKLGDFNDRIADADALGGSGLDDFLGDIGSRAGMVFSRADEDLEELKQQIIDSSEESRALVENLSRVGSALQGGDLHGQQMRGDEFDWYWDNYEKMQSNESFADAFLGNADQIQAMLNSISPAMSELGLTMDDLQSWDFEFGGGAEDLVAMVSHLDSADGKAEALADAIMSLDNGLLSTAESAKMFGTALDEALNPAVGVSEQTDLWVQSLRSLNDDLSSNSNTLRGNSNAALQNRAAIRDRVRQLQATLKAQAEAGASSRVLSRSLQQQRSSLINAGLAAGLSGRQLRAYLRTLGLTPKLVRTIVRAVGVEDNTKRVRELRRQFGSLPKAVRAIIRTEGIPKSKAEAKDLADRLRLVGEPRRALIRLVAEAAKRGITDVNKLLDKTDKNSPEPKITVNTASANAAIQHTQSLLNNLNSKTIYVTTVHRSRKENADGALMDGGTIAFADGGYTAAGRHVPRASTIAAGGANILWGEQETGWEAYISGKPSQRARNRQIWMETGRRLGYDARPMPAQPAMAMQRTVVVERGPSLPDRVVLSVGGQEFVAFVRGEARSEAAGVYDGANEASTQHGRMKWT